MTQGHRISLATAVKVVRMCTDGYRIPRPTREADHYVRDLRRAYQQKLPEISPSARWRAWPAKFSNGITGLKISSV